MGEPRFRLKTWLLAVAVLCGSALSLARLGISVKELLAGKPDQFLAFPLAVILPFSAMLYLVWTPDTSTSEGALMRLAAVALFLLILTVPPFALHLALGFPVAFLLAELFETRLPTSIREAIKRQLIV